MASDIKQAIYLAKLNTLQTIDARLSEQYRDVRASLDKMEDKTFHVSLRQRLFGEASGLLDAKSVVHDEMRRILEDIDARKRSYDMEPVHHGSA